MKTLETMTRVERSLLLFLETCAVDRGGRIASEKMNAEEVAIAKQWNEEGFIQYGRVSSRHLDPSLGNHWCWLSDEAWKLAAEERKARALRIWSARRWQKAGEAGKEGRS
jgi:hypothetical protein